MNKWTGMGEFNSDEHYVYYRGQESLRRNGIALIVNERVQNAVLGCSLKNDRMICSFPRQTIQYHGDPSLCPTSNTEEAEIEQFYEDLQDLLELAPKKRCPLLHKGLECKSRKSRVTFSNR